MKASPLLQLFLEVAEKATQIARVIRKEKALLELLIEEKPEIKKTINTFKISKHLQMYLSRRLSVILLVKR